MNKKNNKISTEENIILNSLGLLDKKSKSYFDAEVKNSSAEDKKKVSEFNNLTSLFSKLSVAETSDVSLSPDVKTKLFEKLKVLENPVKVKKDFDYIFSASSDWEKHPIDGIEFKKLSYNEEKGYLMLLFKVAADTSYPAHHHSGAEECYIISGDVYAQGKILGPGDFHHAEGGSDHEPLYTKNGCTLLLVVEPKDYM
ncbi:MAG TPA: cupin domain-containing protein [Ignavibacteria bacterium]|nr:cupin domain-containing protein [Ignavibacteria bacterium]